MLAFVALISALSATPTAPGSKEVMPYYVAGDTIGGRGGRGGDAHGGATVNCNVPGACVVGPATGGSGGSGGDARSNAPANNNSGPIVGRDEEPSIRSTISRCSLEIGGQTEIATTGCDFERTASNKKIVVSAQSANKKYRYKVTWFPAGNGTAQGYLQGGKSSAVRSLGTLYSQGACWVKGDSSVKICAWK